MVRSIVQIVKKSNDDPIEKTIIVKRCDNMAEELTDQELEQLMKELNDIEDDEMEYIGDEEMDDEEIDDNIDPDEIEIDEVEDFTQEYI